jgi:hypothetical protein
MGTTSATSQAGVRSCYSRGWRQQQRRMRSQSCQAPRRQRSASRVSRPIGPRFQGRLLDCKPNIMRRSVGMQTLMQACTNITAAECICMHACRRTIDPAGPFIQLLQSRFVHRGFETAWEVQPTPAGALQVKLPSGIGTYCVKDVVLMCELLHLALSPICVTTAYHPVRTGVTASCVYAPTSQQLQHTLCACKCQQGNTASTSRLLSRKLFASHAE